MAYKDDNILSLRESLSLEKVRIKILSASWNLDNVDLLFICLISVWKLPILQDVRRMAKYRWTDRPLRGHKYD